MLSPFQVKLFRIILKLIIWSMCDIPLGVSVQIKKRISVLNTTVSLLCDRVHLSNGATGFDLNLAIFRHLTTRLKTPRERQYINNRFTIINFF